MSAPDISKGNSKLKLPGLSSFLSPGATQNVSLNQPLNEEDEEETIFLKDQIRSMPMIRESHYGQTIGLRSKAQIESWSDGQFPVGGPDLIHWGKYHGTRSSQYLDHDFGLTEGQKNSNNDDDLSRKNDDGYVGYYHYANGVDVSREENIENYICKLVGIEKVGISNYKKLNDDLLRLKYQQQLSSMKSSKSNGSGGASANVSGITGGSVSTTTAFSSSPSSSARKEMMITFCTYNIFNKSDFRARYVINLTSPIRVDKSFQVLSGNKKTYSFNPETIKQLSQQFWDELRASQLIRLFADLDDPSRQLAGLVSLPDLVSTPLQLSCSIKTLVKLLPRGTVTDYKARDGFSSGWGDKRDGYKKTIQYKNYLVDSLIRCCQFSGEACNIAVNEIITNYTNNEWDYIILQIWKVQNGTGPMEQKFINLIHQHIMNQPESTQKTLILLEQVKFLLSKEKYAFALKVAEKCVKSLPLDFECWYYLVLCNILDEKHERALVIMNSLPIITSHKQRNGDVEKISGIPDFYINTFVNRLNENYDELISERTFLNYFPKPVVQMNQYQRINSKQKSKNNRFVDEGSIDHIWNEMFLFDSSLRHSITGNQFYQSPLMNAGARELSSVDPNLIKLCGPLSMKSILASQSAGTPTASILDFTEKSTWGRTYDLLSLFVGLVGWDALVGLKERVFKKRENSTKKVLVVSDELETDKFYCEKWLDQLFVIIYEDLKTYMSITAPSKDQQHSALEWEVLGFLGWTIKLNIKESICALVTSVKGKEMVGGFDYFGSIQLLSIYNEFVLSEVKDSQIDRYHDTYEGKLYSHKLLVKKFGAQRNEEFVRDIEEGLLDLDFILLHLMKLISWNLRWYQYLPNNLITVVLTKLMIKYDPVFIRGKIRIIFEQNKKVEVKEKSSKLSFGFLVKSSSKKEQVSMGTLFMEGDTIVDYVEMLLTWIESLTSQ